jgi:hypothetical protein
MPLRRARGRRRAASRHGREARLPWWDFLQANGVPATRRDDRCVPNSRNQGEKPWHRACSRQAKGMSRQRGRTSRGATKR